MLIANVLAIIMKRTSVHICKGCSTSIGLNVSRKRQQIIPIIAVYIHGHENYIYICVCITPNTMNLVMRTYCGYTSVQYYNY